MHIRLVTKAVEQILEGANTLLLFGVLIFPWMEVVAWSRQHNSWENIHTMLKDKAIIEYVRKNTRFGLGENTIGERKRNATILLVN